MKSAVVGLVVLGSIAGVPCAAGAAGKHEKPHPTHTRRFPICVWLSLNPIPWGAVVTRWVKAAVTRFAGGAPRKRVLGMVAMERGVRFWIRKGGLDGKSATGG